MIGPPYDKPQGWAEMQVQCAEAAHLVYKATCREMKLIASDRDFWRLIEAAEESFIRRTAAALHLEYEETAYAASSGRVEWLRPLTAEANPPVYARLNDESWHMMEPIP